MFAFHAGVRSFLGVLYVFGDASIASALILRHVVRVVIRGGGVRD